MNNFKWWTSSNGVIEFRMHQDDVERIAQPGDNDEAVETALDHSYLTLQLGQLNIDDVRAALTEYALWSDQELADATANLRRLVWVAAADIKEWDDMEQSDDIEI